MSGEWGRPAALAAVLIGVATAAGAAEKPVTGRWAPDQAGCASAGFFSAGEALVVTDYAVRWQNDSCRIERSYKTGDTVHIEAQCWGGNGQRSVPVSLRPAGGKLQLRWDRVRTADLKRCD